MRTRHTVDAADPNNLVSEVAKLRDEIEAMIEGLGRDMAKLRSDMGILCQNQHALLAEVKGVAGLKLLNEWVQSKKATDVEGQNNPDRS